MMFDLLAPYGRGRSVVALCAACVALLVLAAPSFGARLPAGGADLPAVQAPPDAAEGAKARAGAVSAAVALTPCDSNPDRLCGTVDVPLDRSKPSAGTIGIHIEVYPHAGPDPTNEAIFVSSGGPGDSATQNPFYGDFLRGLFEPLLETRDLVLIDQRGVGLSEVIDCPRLQTLTEDTDIYDAVGECGAQLGDAAHLYGSAEVAKDMEAVRQALGVERLNLYGGSYASMDIQAYAARFPDRIRSIVMDTPFTTVGYDTFFEETAEAVVRTVRLVCKRSRSCSAEHRDAARELEWLAERLRKRPVDGVGFDADGVPHTVHVTEAALNKIASTDAGGFLAVGELAAAAEALREGDRVPLLRLAAENDVPIFATEDEATVFSAGDSWARFCADAVPAFPWRQSASIDERFEQFEDAVDDLDRDEFDPFSVDAWLAPPPNGVSPEACIVWPELDRKFENPVPTKAKYPKTPTLVLSADLDTSTPTAMARRVDDLFPNSRLIEIANSGHHTAINARFQCAGALIVSFLQTLTPGDTRCASSNEFVFPGLGEFPEEAEDAEPATSVKRGKKHSRRGRRHHSGRTDRRNAQVAAVAADTVFDAIKRSFLQSQEHGAGLRGGTFTATFDDTGVTFEFDGARFAEDVAVSGSARVPFAEQSVLDADVTVDGPRGADGSLHVTGVVASPGATTLRVQGELGGRAIDVRVPAT